MTNFLKYFMVLFIICRAGFVFGAGAEKDFLYIFDASGSMEGPMEEKTKFTIASKMLIESIKKLPSNIGTGLIYFGNKIKGEDCIRFAVPVETGSKEKVIKEIERLKPGGLTPLAKSIKTGAEFLERQSKSAAFVLITDGNDECGGNPVEVVKNLAERGMIIEIHIIGLRVSEKVRQELNRIAAASGGNFYDVNSSKQLQESLENIVSSVLGGQILRLTAKAGVIKTSKDLHSVRSGEILSVKFKPVEALGAREGDESMIFFDMGKVRIELKDLGNQWELYKNDGSLDQKLAWPKDLVVDKSSWNQISIDNSRSENIFIINEKMVLDLSSEIKDVNFKVGVEGYDCSFKDLTTQLPLY